LRPTQRQIGFGAFSQKTFGPAKGKSAIHRNLAIKRRRRRSRSTGRSTTEEEEEEPKTEDEEEEEEEDV